MGSCVSGKIQCWGIRWVVPCPFLFGIAVKPGLCWWAFAASQAPQFSNPSLPRLFYSVMEPANRAGIS